MLHSQKGVSLIITFFIMTIMLAIVLSVSVILLSEIKVMGNIGNAVQSFYSAESGSEKVLYFDRKQIPNGYARGICNICNTCGSADCTHCITTPITYNGCNLQTCNNCEITYDAIFEDKNYSVNAKVKPNLSGGVTFTVDSKGVYKETTRAIETISINP